MLKSDLGEQNYIFETFSSKKGGDLKFMTPATAD